MEHTTLVTGATGHLGHALVRSLVAAGRRVRALVRSERALPGLDVERVRGDVRDADAVRKAASGCAVVHHLAAVVRLQPWDTGDMEDVNVGGTRHVVEAVRAEGARLVHCGSIHVYRGGHDDSVVDESRPYALDPGGYAYDRTKARASALVDDAVGRGLDAVTVHPTGVLGPFDLGSSNQGTWIRRLAAGKEPVVVCGGSDWVDVRDVVAASIAAEDPARAAVGEHFLLGGRRAEALEVASLVAREVGRRPPSVVLPLGLLRAIVPAVDVVTGALRVRTPFTAAAIDALDTHRYVSHEKAARALGHRPRPLEDTVRDTVRWYREQAMLP